MNGPLDQYRKSKYSQHGEDGILEFLTGRLQIEKGWCMEFGAHNGTTFSNTLALIEKGWHGLYVEPNPNYWPALAKLDNWFHKLRVILAYIDDKVGVSQPVPDTPIITIEEALDIAKFPKDFDVLSIDTDEDDRAIWQSLTNYRPKVVVIETNSSKISYFRTMVGVGESKGYTCLGHCGNLVFVRDEDFEAFGIAREEVADPDQLYTPNEADW